ncbi:hypothetical protein GYA49_03810 [Candidatus Beckwithbacteria bacterium]|nr:hypothetical protein [Candidatus Beckwithbacteria bacterium]
MGKENLGVSEQTIKKVIMAVLDSGSKLTIIEILRQTKLSENTILKTLGLMDCVSYYSSGVWNFDRPRKIGYLPSGCKDCRLAEFGSVCIIHGTMSVGSVQEQCDLIYGNVPSGENFGI